MDELTERKYAALLLNFGLRLRQGQRLLLELPQEHWRFARILSEEAYGLGAEEVVTFYNDLNTELPRLRSSAPSGIMCVPEWRREAMHSLLYDGGASLSFISPYPEAAEALSETERRVWADHQNAARNIVREAVRELRIQWCYAALPNADWARQVYPSLGTSSAYEKLSRVLMDICMVNGRKDPIEKWIDEYDRLSSKARRLSELPLRAVRVTTSLGTELEIGLHPDCVWDGGISRSEFELGAFQPNIPSFEVCTTTFKSVASGRLVASMPLSFNGCIISGIEIEFQGGKAVFFSAESGADILRQIIEHDDGSAYLGEIAFVERDSPIAREHTLFYNTLLDENAACHLALGAGFPGNIRGINPRDEGAARERGVNFSGCHVDIMFGTADVCADGVLVGGDTVAIMRGGRFVL